MSIFLMLFRLYLYVCIYTVTLSFNVLYRRVWAHLLVGVSEGYYVCGEEGWGVLYVN